MLWLLNALKLHHHGELSKAGCVDRAAVPPSPDRSECLVSRLRCVRLILMHVAIYGSSFLGLGFTMQEFADHGLEAFCFSE